MTPLEVFGVVLALAASVAVGVVAHELSHAAALWLFGVPCRIEWLPGGDAGLLSGVAVGKLAAVSPDVSGRERDGRTAHGLRVAAMTPLALASPFALVPLGLLPDPFAAGGPYLQAAAIGWLACALPSPQDFSLLWHAERALVERQ